MQQFVGYLVLGGGLSLMSSVEAGSGGRCNR
jgi:hypothetical protein